MAAPREIDLLFLSAAQTGDMAMLQRLTEKYKNGEGPGKVRYSKLYKPGGHNALHLAAKAGKTAACRFLIENLKFDVNGAAAECSANGDTALLLSSLHGHQRATIFLLENGADVRKCNIFGEIPLHYAAKNGSKETIKLLITKGSDLNAMSVMGTPVVAAAVCGNHVALKYLLDLKADPNPSNSYSEQTPLLAALKIKSRECVKLLLEAGADPNRPCMNTTPLKAAACQLDLEIIKCLLNAGADPNVQDPVGNTPLESAAFVYRRDVVELLFPVTSPIPKYPHWSTSEVIQYQETEEAKTQYTSKYKEFIPLAKAKAGEAFRRKNYADALAWYVQAGMTGEINAKLLSNMSLCCTKMNWGDLALSEAQSCVKLEPKWAKAHYREGAAWNVLKKFEKAAEAFSRALACDPGNKEIKKAYMEAQVERNRFKHWDEEYIRNQSTDVEIVECMLKAGADPNVQDPVGPLESAAYVYRRDVAKLLFPVTSPISKYPHWNLNEVIQYQESFVAPMQYMSKFREVIPLAKAKGGEAFRRKNYWDAVSWYVQAGMTGEVDAKLLSNRSLCCTKMNMGDQALADARECIKRKPNWAKAHYREGAAWNVLKDFTKAAEAFSRALALDPGNEEIKKAYMDAQAKRNKFKHWNEEYVLNESPDISI